MYSKLAVSTGTVTGRVTGLLMTGPTSSSDDLCSVFGLMLLAGLLVLDGVTSTLLEELFMEPLASKYDRMLYINLGIFVGIGRMRPHHSFVRL